MRLVCSGSGGVLVMLPIKLILLFQISWLQMRHISPTRRLIFYWDRLTLTRRITGPDTSWEDFKLASELLLVLAFEFFNVFRLTLDGLSS
jgi:hypothetical protein